MKEVDYLVVGLGIAGISFCEQLELANKSFIVVDSGEKGASQSSGGILNPVVLKRFNAAWNASVFYPKAISFYQALSLKLKKDIFQPTPILRILNNPEEQNNWVVASEKVGLQNFLQTQLLKNTNLAIISPFGFGKLMGTAIIQKDDLISSYKNMQNLRGRILKESFEYDKLKVDREGVSYKNINAKKVVFCEGADAIKNPFLSKDAVTPNKGEYLVIHAPDLNLKELLKGPVFIIPLGNDLYKVGATYARDETSKFPTAEASQEILSKVKRMINCSFEIKDQTGGIRPTTRDRKPFLGSLDSNPHLVFLNGLGTHGFLMAPYLSEVLYANLEGGGSIPAEIDVNRLVKVG